MQQRTKGCRQPTQYLWLYSETVVITFIQKLKGFQVALSGDEK